MRKIAFVFAVLASLTAAGVRAQSADDTNRYHDPIHIKSLVTQADPITTSDEKTRNDAWRALYQAAAIRPDLVLEEASALAGRRDLFDEGTRRAYSRLLQTALSRARQAGIPQARQEALILPLKNLALDADAEYIHRYYAAVLLGGFQGGSPDSDAARALLIIEREAHHDNLRWHARNLRVKPQETPATPAAEGIEQDMESVRAALSGT